MPSSKRKSEQPSSFSGAWWKRAGKASWIATRDLFWDDGPHWAAAIAYYALLSFIPVMLLVALAASLVIDSDLAVEQLGGMLEDLLPEGEEQIQQIVDRAYQGRAVAGFFSVLALLWSGTRIFGAATKALNVAYDIDRSYGVIKQFLIQVVMLVFMGGLIVTGILSRTLLGMIWQLDALGLPERGMIIGVIEVVMPFLLTTLGFVLVYRFVPRHRPGWWPSLAGGLVAAIMFWGGRGLFLVYLRSFANYDDIYGPIAIVIIVILWIWVAALILLFGGQLVSHYQEILVEGEAPDDVERRHRQAKQNRDRPGGDD